MENEKGSVTLFAVLAITFACFLFLKGVAVALIHYQNLVKLTHESLCLKSSITQTIHLMKKVNKINRYLELLDKGKKIGSVIPQLRVVGMVGEVGAQGLKLYQNSLLIRHLKQLTSHQGKTCKRAFTFLKTPYQHHGIRFLRQSNGVTKTRRSPWVVHVTKPFPLKVEFHHRVTRSKVSVRITPLGVLPSWRPSVGSHF